MEEITFKFMDLPTEMMESIMSKMSLEELKNMSRTNKQCLELTKRYIVEKCVLSLPPSEDPDYPAQFKRKYQAINRKFIADGWLVSFCGEIYPKIIT